MPADDDDWPSSVVLAFTSGGTATPITGLRFFSKEDHEHKTEADGVTWETVGQLSQCVVHAAEGQGSPAPVYSYPERLLQVTRGHGNPITHLSCYRAPHHVPPLLRMRTFASAGPGEPLVTAAATEGLHTALSAAVREATGRWRVQGDESVKSFVVKQTSGTSAALLQGLHFHFISKTQRGSGIAVVGEDGKESDWQLQGSVANIKGKDRTKEVVQYT